MTHAVIALHGRFKNELGERCHLMPLVPKTHSGLIPAKWMERMLSWYDETGVIRGPVFRTSDGRRARQSQFSFSILCRLVQVSEESASLFPDKGLPFFRISVLGTPFDVAPLHEQKFWSYQRQ